MKRISLFIMCTALLVPLSLYTCLLDITNDTEQDAMLVSITGEKGTIIAAGKTGQFGSKKKRPHFYLLLHNEESGLFEYQKTVQQVSCSPTKDDVFVSIKGLVHGNLTEPTASMFTLTRKKSIGKVIHEEEDDDTKDDDHHDSGGKYDHGHAAHHANHDSHAAHGHESHHKSEKAHSHHKQMNR